MKNLMLPALAIAAMVALLAVASLTIAIPPELNPRAVLVLTEPGALELPTGKARAVVGELQVPAALRATMTRHAVAAVRRAAPVRELRPDLVAGRPVVQPRKGQLIPPDALIDLSNLFVLEVPGDANLPALVEELRAQAGIVYAEPPVEAELTGSPGRPTGEGRRSIRSTSLPNDPDFIAGKNWGLYWPTKRDADIGAPEAWERTTGSPDVRIAILDTGIDSDHPDLEANMGLEYDFVDNDFNAFPDPFIGDPSHGLRMAGVAAAVTNNGVGGAGVCGGWGPTGTGCRILAAKVLGTCISCYLTNPLTARIANAVTWALNNDARAISNSYCFNSDFPNITANAFAVHAAFRNAFLQGSTVAVAMGNSDGSCGQDAPNEGVEPAIFGVGGILMAVGGTNKFAERITSPFESGTGSWISVMAPTHQHYAPVLGGTTGPSGGTSTSTPFVAGLAGLLHSLAEERGYTLDARSVERIIALTALDRGPVGHDVETGYGLIKADKALEALDEPNELTYATAPPVSNCHSLGPLENWTFWASETVKKVKRCELRRTVTFSETYQGTPLVWGRPIAGGGASPSNPNSEIGFTGIVDGSVTSNSVTLKTFAYQVYSFSGVFEGWYPAAPQLVNFGYAVLGEPEPPPPPPPFYVSASAPSYVTVKQWYPLNGSASHAAHQWDWDRRVDGGSWTNWASQQNTGFTAYAGDYTLDWKLRATRVSDGIQDTDIATTVVCTTGSCDGPPPVELVAGYDQDRAALAPHLASDASALSSVASTDPAPIHFGSGVWVGRQHGRKALVDRYYSLLGHHDLEMAGGEWPNLLETESVSWTLPAHSDRVSRTISSRRQRWKDGVDLFRINGEVVDRQAGTRPISFALAADPDLGEPHDDELGFDESRELVWVGDVDSTFVGYVVLDAPRGARVAVVQYGMGLDDEPTQAQQEFAKESSWAEGVKGDVRFLLTVDRVDVDEHGRFDINLAVLRANSLAELTGLVDELRTSTGAVLASMAPPELSGDPEPRGLVPDEFALGQRLPGLQTVVQTGNLVRREAPMARSVIGGQPSQGGASSAAVAQAIRVSGVTALNFDVPEASRVIIRIYDRSGAMVRTLLDEDVDAGAYAYGWDGHADTGQRMPPGVYYAVMEAEGFSDRSKLILVR